MMRLSGLLDCALHVAFFEREPARLELCLEVSIVGRRIDTLWAASEEPG